MLARTWDTIKTVLALVILIVAALVSADRIDRQQPGRTAGLGSEPTVTGSVQRPVR